MPAAINRKGTQKIILSASVGILFGSSLSAAILPAGGGMAANAEFPTNDSAIIRLFHTPFNVLTPLYYNAI